MNNLNKNHSFTRLLTGNPYVIPLIIIVAMFGAGQVLTGGFATVKNIGSILTFSCVIAILTFSQIMVIASGGDGIDLSLGAVMSISAVLTPSFISNNVNRMPIAIVFVLAIGAAVGFFNASGILLLGISPLIMTMIMAAVVDGAAMASTQGMPPGSIPDLLLKLGSSAIGPISWLLIVTIIVLILMILAMRKTAYGKKLFLTGSNRAAADICGLNTRVTVYLAYMFAGMLSALGGVFLVGYTGSAILKMANGYNLFSVAAAVLGGAKLTGGEGSMLGGFLGAIIFTLLNNVLLAVGLPYGVRITIQGLTLLIILSLYSREGKMRQ